jgi:hypothetical protein
MKKIFKSKLFKYSLGFTGLTLAGLLATDKLEDAQTYGGGIARAIRCAGYGTQIIGNYLLV